MLNRLETLPREARDTLFLLLVIAVVLAPQAGHSDRGASETFCKTSLAWPQDPHL